MKKKIRNILSAVLVLVVAGVVFIYIMMRPTTKLVALSELNEGTPNIAQNELYFKWNRGQLKEFPIWDGNLDNNFNVDLRSYDVSGYDLSAHLNDLQYALFDTDTIWPEFLPDGFDPHEIMETGKNPGLGIRQLHKLGITGKGVSIAIIDQALLLEHEEYKDNIMLYERIHCQDDKAQMHGPAVASIAVGKTTGVAPDAKLYYIASTFGTYFPLGAIDLTYMADSIYRVLEINEVLPPDEKIRVISISKGFNGEEKGGGKVIEAIEAAKKAGVFVITTSTRMNYDFSLSGLGRGLYDDPDDMNSYTPGLFWSERYYNDENWSQTQNRLLVPMDSRSFASFTGTSNYAFGRMGGYSWTCPWLAGMYALCLQVNPDITPDEFINAALDTGNVINLKHEDKDYSLGTVINPLNLIGYFSN